ncbi:MAG: hypothetical protein RI973_1894 [Bacteroidota bacterium]
MSEIEIKLRIIRLIISQKGDILQELYNLILSKLFKEKKQPTPLSALESGYKEMSEDVEREKEALEWAEGTLNGETL